MRAGGKKGPNRPAPLKSKERYRRAPERDSSRAAEPMAGRSRTPARTRVKLTRYFQTTSIPTCSRVSWTPRKAPGLLPFCYGIATVLVRCWSGVGPVLERYLRNATQVCHFGTVPSSSLSLSILNRCRQHPCRSSTEARPASIIQCPAAISSLLNPRRQDAPKCAKMAHSGALRGREGGMVGEWRGNGEEMDGPRYR